MLENNKVTVVGEVFSEPKFSHEIFGESFYEFLIKISRLSSSHDVIPVTISERLMEDGKIKVGNVISVAGQFRSYNKLEENKSRLMLTIFVREFIDLDKKVEANQIEITGFLCKEPIYRTTPFNREICDVLLAVNRSYNKSDYIPCIAWGRNARYIKNCKIGEKIKVVGRIQSREYQKKLDNGEFITKVAYEVSLNRIIVQKESNFNSSANSIKENLGSILNPKVEVVGA